MPCLSHGIQNLFQDWFSTFGAFGRVFVFVTGFAPGIFIADDEGCCCAEGLDVRFSMEKDEGGRCGEKVMEGQGTGVRGGGGGYITATGAEEVA